MKTFKLTSGHSLCNTTQKTLETTIEIHQKSSPPCYVVQYLDLFSFCFIWPACCLIYIHHFLHIWVCLLLQKMLIPNTNPLYSIDSFYVWQAFNFLLRMCVCFISKVVPCDNLEKVLFIVAISLKILVLNKIPDRVSFSLLQLWIVYC